MRELGRFEALRFHRLGEPVDVLQVDCLEAAPLADGDVRIEVAAFALNRADWLYTKEWHYSVPELPSRIGSECAGTIVAVGADIDDSLIGKRVCTVPFDTCKYGVQGAIADIPVEFIVPWPTELSAEEAAATWMQYLTAYFALIGIAGIEAGDFLFVPAASSSAGLAAIQLAKMRGAMVIAGTRSPSKVDPLRAAGADHIVLTAETAGLAKTLRNLSGEAGVRVVFDPIGGDFMQHYDGALGRNAQIILFGLLSGEQTRLNLVPLVRANAVIHPYSMFNHVMDATALTRAIAFVEGAVKQGLRPVIDQVFGWSEALESYRRLDSQAQIGKIIVSMEHGK